MDENYIEITKSEIKAISDKLENDSTYKLKDSHFNTNAFKNRKTIIIIQNIADNEFELSFKTKAFKNKFYIENSFNIIKEDILTGTQTRDVFQAVNKYFQDVIANPEDDFSSQKDELIKLLLYSGEYDKSSLELELDQNKIIDDYNNDKEIINNDTSLTDIQKSLALKELVHMSICKVIDDIDLFYTRPVNLTEAEEAEKQKQEKLALENELKLS